LQRRFHRPMQQNPGQPRFARKPLFWFWHTPVFSLWTGRVPENSRQKIRFLLQALNILPEPECIVLPLLPDKPLTRKLQPPLFSYAVRLFGRLPSIFLNPAGSGCQSVSAQQR